MYNQTKDTVQYELNESGQLINVLTLIDENKKKENTKSWVCNESVCKVYKPDLMEHYERFLRFLTKINLNNIRLIADTTERCNAIHANPSKLGHPSSCYVDFRTCSSQFISTLILAPHFPNVRYIKTLIYRISRLIKKIDETDEALDNADLGYLQTEYTEVKETIKSTEHEQSLEIELNEDCIKEKYFNAFEALRKKTKDVPIRDEALVGFDEIRSSGKNRLRLCMQLLSKQI